MKPSTADDAAEANGLTGESPSLLPDHQGSELLKALLYPKLRALYLPLLAPWPEDTTELVHDSRVASRRLVEALELSQSLFEPLEYKKFRRRAKLLRRALGASRETDVLCEDLAELGRIHPQLEDAVKQAQEILRGLGGAGFEQARKDYPAKRFGKHIRQIIQALDRCKLRYSLRDLAAPHLYQRVHQAEILFPSVETIERGVEQHDLRVEIKKIRYTTEILSQPFAHQLDGPAMVKACKKLQDALGRMNDALDLVDQLKSGLLSQHLPEELKKPLLEAAIQTHRDKYFTARKSLLEHGPETFGILRRASGHIGII